MTTTNHAKILYNKTVHFEKLGVIITPLAGALTPARGCSFKSYRLVLGKENGREPVSAVC